MIQPTINDAVTIGGAEALLAGRYHVVKQLGQGGMGSVYLAEDTQLDNFRVAVKMLPAILVANKRALKQLTSEALVSMKLIHSNIVPLRGFEENNGNPFLVMDYIDGQTLDDLLAEKEKLTDEETIRVLAPVAAALDYAHGEGVVHRDVKPGNVIIRKDGRPFVLDFGIAREIQETMTRVTGKLSSGTLLYMSPEQNNGDEPTPAQDVYSFAAMAYECLAGKPPFTRGNIEYQIMNTPPAPLTGKAAILAAGVMAGLAKRPEDRPSTCAAVLEGSVFSRKEVVALVATEAGVSHPVTTIRGSGALAASPGRAGVSRPPQGDEIVSVEHVERVEGKAPDGGEGNVSRKKMVIGLVALLGLTVVAVVGGVWWNGRTTRDAERIKSEAERAKSAKRAKAEAERAKAEWEERELKGADATDNGHTKVQLWDGGPYWSDTNIGAKKPWESGYYFWWGDTVGYKPQGDAWKASWVASDGSKSNFSFEERNTPTYVKGIAILRSAGWITSDNILVPEHDAAQVQWGDGWRMPTDRELQDLVEKCDWTWSSMNGVKGYVVRGKGNYASASIFLPAVGSGDGTWLNSAGSDGHYWSSVPSSGNYYYGSRRLHFYSGDHYHGTYNDNYHRRHGCPVRPVQDFAK